MIEIFINTCKYSTFLSLNYEHVTGLKNRVCFILKVTGERLVVH